MLLLRFVLLSTLAFAAALPVRAQAPVPAEVAQAIQATVRSQLSAFAADDAERAFSFAAPGIREMFGNAGNFMGMVRDSYPAVYRHAASSFLAPRADGDFVAQPVHLTDTRGSSWIAIYRLQKQPDGQWRIAGCVLVPAGSGRTA
jgi:hypothetical protein